MQYYVVVWTYHPYKIEQAFTEIASNHAVATRRAIDKFRKTEKLKGKKLVEICAKSRRA